MKTLSVIFYIIGSGLLIASCFTTGVALTWWLGGFAVASLIAGCVCQYNTSRSNNENTHHHSHGY